MTVVKQGQRVVFHDERDRMLAALAASVELSDTQRKRAIKSYEAVGAWLADDDGTLAGRHEEIFAQGSMALGTTVKPAAGNEFDIDLVAGYSWDPSSDNSFKLYKDVLARLRAHGVYRDILEEKPNCIRLNYLTDGFHLDVVPACANPSAEGHLIKHPKAEANTPPNSSWRETDPRGFQLWFRSRCAVDVRLERRAVASVEPVPVGNENGEKLPLQIIVQLIKQARNVAFGTNPAPSSILLTTLAANRYEGEVSLYEGLSNVVAEIDDEIEAAAPFRIVICNPAYPHDDLVECLDDETYRRFRVFISALRKSLDNLGSVAGIHRVKEALEGTFGSRPVSSAVDSVFADFKDSGTRQALRTLPSGIVTVTGAADRRPQGVPNPRHTFHCEP